MRLGFKILLGGLTYIAGVVVGYLSNDIMYEYGIKKTKKEKEPSGRVFVVYDNDQKEPVEVYADFTEKGQRDLVNRDITEIVMNVDRITMKDLPLINKNDIDNNTVQ